jgi:small-conductance mechanosensitive channel
LIDAQETARVSRARPILAVCLAGAFAAAAHTAAAQDARPERAISADLSGDAATLVFFNRPIVVLRARVLGRSPADRVDSARRALNDLVMRHVAGPVDWRPFAGGAIVSVASRGVLALTPPDVDEVAGETVDAVAARTAVNLQRALEEAIAARTPGMLLWSIAAAIVATTLTALALWGIARAHWVVARRLVVIAERTVERSGIADVAALRASRLPDVERWFVNASAASLALAVVYAAVGFVLRQFPYTRPWGASMRSVVLTTVENLGLGAAAAVPGLITVAIIFFIARVLARLIGFWFSAIERGRLTPRWIYPETAQPTRRLLTGLVWAFAIIVAYPYLPGSQTDAFKGVSVFLGLMVTFGSSGLVNQVMSGFMVTYSRALRVGDFVRIGDVEGTVTFLGVLSTKLKTLCCEEVTIPNAVVVSQTTTDYSRFGDTHGVFTPTAVTIGYDAPWRQVHSLLLLAAERTPGLRRQPQPLVLQTALEDFYVKYTLLVCLERQESRLITLGVLHANIQDLFNEYGVQIMSPNYVIDPAAPKIVARKDWFAPPAESDREEPVTAGR